MHCPACTQLCSRPARSNRNQATRFIANCNTTGRRSSACRASRQVPHEIGGSAYPRISRNQRQTHTHQKKKKRGAHACLGKAELLPCSQLLLHSHALIRLPARQSTVPHSQYSSAQGLSPLLLVGTRQEGRATQAIEHVEQARSDDKHVLLAANLGEAPLLALAERRVGRVVAQAACQT